MVDIFTKGRILKQIEEEIETMMWVRLQLKCVRNCNDDERIIAMIVGANFNDNGRNLQLQRRKAGA
jgi:hypothetical protein